MNESDEEMIEELEKILEEGTFEKHYKPVKVHSNGQRSVVYAIRFSPDEAEEFAKAATQRGITLADFLRNAARAAVDGQLDVDRSAALGEARKHARELNEALSRL